MDLELALTIGEAAAFTAGCAVIHAFRGQPNRLTPSLAAASVVLSMLVYVVGASTYKPTERGADGYAKVALMTGQ